MKKHVLYIFIFFCSEKSACAQFSQDWINNFCCFDAVAPHTFSYPLGREISNDTLTLSFYEDNFLNLKKINLATGADIQLVTFSLDTVQSPFYYGGGTAFTSAHSITSALKYNSLTGETKLVFSSFSKTFTLEWSSEIPVVAGRFSKPVFDHADTSFFTALVSDSIRIFRHNMDGNPEWITSVAAGHANTNTDPRVMLNSSGEPIVYVEETDLLTFDSRIRLLELNQFTGSILADTIYTDTKGNNRKFSQAGDSLRTVFNKMPGNEIAFVNIDLLNLAVTKYFSTGITNFNLLSKFAVDTTTGNYFLKTSGSIFGFSNHDSLLFNTVLTSAADEQYDHGEINFNQSGNLVFTSGFFNTSNSPVNVDLKSVVIDKISGAVLFEIDYNDARNTDENFIDQFMVNGNYYMLFANNFDNASILQEETQLGIVKYSFLPTSVLNSSSEEMVVNLFPNPFYSFATIKISDEGLKNSELIIYNLFGEVIRQCWIINGQSILSRDGMPDGIYFYKLINNSSQTSCGKFVID